MINQISQIISAIPFQKVTRKAEEYFENIGKKTNQNGEIVQQSPFWARSTLLGLMGSALFAMGWLALAETDEVVTVTGKLEPKGSVQDVQMPLGGIASQILVKDGEEVTSGQIVMHLDAEATEQRLDSQRKQGAKDTST